MKMRNIPYDAEIVNTKITMNKTGRTGLPDERIQFFWRQTSGTGRSIPTITPKEYFNKITRNNQGNVDEIIYCKLHRALWKKKMIKKWEELE